MRYRGKGLTAPIVSFFDTYTTNPGIDLGTRIECADGTVFRFVKTDATGIGIALIAAYGNTAALDIEASSYVVSVTNTNGTEESDPIVELGTGTLTANAWDDGYLVIDSSTGAGQFRPIKRNTTTKIYLEYPLTTAVAATSHGHLLANPWSKVKLAVASGTNFNKCVGVCIKALAANEFGWVMSRGICAVIDSATTAIGLGMVQGTTAGNVLSAPTNTAAPIVASAFYLNTGAGDATLAYVNFEN